MNYLLDTHTFLWSLFSPGTLSGPARKTILDNDNEISVSIVTFWEISLKYNLGKLELNNISPEELPGMAERTGFRVYPLDVFDVASFYKLPRDIHKDPFDRLLIWQAIRNNLAVISADVRFREYGKAGLHVIW